MSEDIKHVVGIDPSYSGLGVAVIDEKGRHITKTFREGARGKEVRQRVARIDALVSSVFSMLDGLNISAVAIENYAFGMDQAKAKPGEKDKKRGATLAFKTGELGGMLRNDLCALGPDFPVFEVAIGTLKMFLSGNGRASKDDQIAAALNRYGVPVTSDDEADAYGLARLAGCAVGLWKPLDPKQSQAVETACGVSTTPQKTIQSLFGGDEPPPF